MKTNHKILLKSIKPQPKEILWVAITFGFFFVLSLGVNHFRSTPLDIFGGGTQPKQKHKGDGKKNQNWSFCNLNDLDSFRASAELLIIDARPGLFHKYGHIPGAISLPAQAKELIMEAGKILSGVPKDRIIVIYCADAQCENAEYVAAQVSRLGYDNIHIFSGGWAEWAEAGRPVEK